MALGNIFAERVQAGRAIDEYDRALELDPELALAFYRRALVREAMGDFRGAAEDLGETAELAADSHEALTRLAWILATHPDPEARDGKRAIAYAKSAVALTGGRDAEAKSALAAAFAERGIFDEAAAMETAAVELLSAEASADRSKRLALARARLQSYRNHLTHPDR